MKAYFLWLAKFITIILVTAIFIPVIVVVIASAVVGFGEMQKSPGQSSKRSVAVIELNGVIENSKEIVDELYKQAQNPGVEGIVLRIDSPGGSVGPSQDIYQAVKELKAKKPIVASMASVAASGGLYSALSASKILAQPGTLTGSIGVIMQLPNLTKIAEKAGFEMITIKTGALKDTGNSFRPMSESDRQFLEETALKVYADFVTAVSDSRSIPRETVLTFADGRVIIGSEAKQIGLIDDLGGVYDAARAVFDIKGSPLPEGEVPRLVYKSDPFEEVRRAINGVTKTISSFDLRGGSAKVLYQMIY